jgi:hypothetical protein
MGLKHWRHFRDEFDKCYFDVLAPDLVQNIASMDVEGFLSLPHIVLFAQDASLLHLFVDTILRRVFKNHSLTKQNAELEVACNSTKHVVKYKHSSVHNEVDMEVVSNGQRQFLMEFIHKHISMTRTIAPGVSKRIVVIHSMEKCQHQFAMRKMLETCAQNVLFIMTAKSIQSVNEALQSRAMCINASVSNTRFDAFFETFVEEQGIDQAEIDRNDGTTYTILNLGAGNQDDGLEKCVRDHVSMLLTPPAPDLYKVIISNREFAYKMLHYQAPCARIFKHVVNACCGNKLPKGRLVKVLSLAADLEHKAIMMSKPSMLVERLLLEVWRHGQKL